MKLITNDECREIHQNAIPVKKYRIQSYIEHQVVVLSLHHGGGHQSGVNAFAVSLKDAAAIRNLLNQVISEFLEPYLDQ